MGSFYTSAKKYFNKIDKAYWVEVGVDRGEGSSKWFAREAKENAKGLYAVDMDPNQIKNLKTKLKDFLENVEIINSTGEEFLKNFATNNPDKKFSLAYLDNFDWDYWVGKERMQWVSDIASNYEKILSTEMTNIRSQSSHLLQAIYLLPLMTENNIIICDDTWLLPEHGIYSGKCSAVIPLLLGYGYSILDEKDKGIILGKFTN